MKFRYLLMLSILVLAFSCEAKESKDDLLQYFNERSIEYDKSVKDIHVIDLKKMRVSERDFSSICSLGTVSHIFIQSSHLEIGAISGLEGCSQLKRIAYEPLEIYDEKTDVLSYGELSTIPFDDIEGHNRIHSKEFGLDFQGHGDDIMPYLAKLNGNIGITVPGYSSEKGGPLTDEGVRLFVEARGDRDIPTYLNFIYQYHLTNKSFEYLINLKGLKSLEFGPLNGKNSLEITQEAVHEFAMEYKKRYGKAPMIITGP